MKKMGVLEKLFKQINSDLTDVAPRFALIGGLAVGSLTTPRMTKDVDLCVAVNTDRAAEEIIRHLVDKGYGIVSLLEHVSGRLATIRLTPPRSRSADAEIDLMFCSCGIEDVIVKASNRIRVFGVSTRVATIGHMIAMKVLSESPTRLTDLSDLLNLLRVASSSDMKTAYSALKLIEKRGFNRGKNLTERLKFFCLKKK
mgnify:CR=1 FL=1